MVYGDFVDGVREDAVCNPQGQYGIMKLMGEDLVKDYSRRNCFNYTIIRPSAVYGEHDVNDRVMSKFILSALQNKPLSVNGASERLDFTHVDDTALGIVQAVLSTQTDNKTYNITRGQGHSLLDAAQLVCKIAGSGQVIVNDRDPSFPSRGALNIDAAKTDFGYAPHVDIAEGVTRYIEWMRNDPYWKSQL
jgi:nucleoside-diphosphate-sugar epimerase